MKKKRHNPERRAYKGRSYKKGGRRVRELHCEEQAIETKTVKAKAGTDQ